MAGVREDAADIENSAAQLASLLEIELSKAMQLMEQSNGSVEESVALFFAQQSSAAERTQMRTPVKGKKRPLPSKSPNTQQNGSQRSILTFVTSPSKKPCEYDVSLTGDSISSSSSERNVVVFQGAVQQIATSSESDDTTAENGGEDTASKAEGGSLMTTGVPIIESGGGDVAEPPSEEATSVDRPIPAYDVDKHVWWGSGEPVPYLHLSRAFDALIGTTKRLRKRDILVNMFRALLVHNREDVLPAVYMCSNKLASNFEGVDLGVGGSIVSSAIMQATGATAEQLRTAYKETGDLGDSAQRFKCRQRLIVAPKPLTIRGVFTTLKEIARQEGQGSSNRRRNLMIGLIRACRESETRYIVRTLVQNIRTGATLVSVLSAVALAAEIHHLRCMEQPVPTGQQLATLAQTTAATVKECYNLAPDIDAVVTSLVQGGVALLQQACKPRVGMPIKPMLAKICNGIDDMLAKFQGKPFTCEYKYDGQRAQVHLMEDGTCKLYSRHLEDMTERFPDVIMRMRSMQTRALQSFVLDAELVAVDVAAGNRILPFQTLSTRGRKDVRAEDITVHVCCFAFDLLVLNGEPLLQKTLLERRQELYSRFAETAGQFEFAQHTEAQDEQELTGFFHQALDSSCEGLMAKVLEEDSSYEPSKRSDSWLKIKRDYVQSLQDSFDLVPIGAWWGNGRKAGWYSPILLACYDPETEELQSVCRCMSGFTDVFYQEMTAFYSQRLLEFPKSYFVTSEQPDVWFDPCEVWEIRGADLTISPVHKAAHGRIDSKKGVALRFPRFIRKREDKSIADATAATQIVDMYHLQARKVVQRDPTAKQAGVDDGEEDDEDVFI